MGTRGKEIVGAESEAVLSLLKKAFADEWLAYYQYWIGAKVISGPMKDAVIAELIQHAADELRHADMITERIIQLGGAPVLEPKDWYAFSNCGYEAPEDAYVQEVLKQNIQGEQCAINVYSSLIKTVRDTDPVTYEVAMEILRDEVEHEQDLQDLAEDLEMIKTRLLGT